MFKLNGIREARTAEAHSVWLGIVSTVQHKHCVQSVRCEFNFRTRPAMRLLSILSISIQWRIRVRARASRDPMCQQTKTCERLQQPLSLHHLPVVLYLRWISKPVCFTFDPYWLCRQFRCEWIVSWNFIYKRTRTK